MFACKIDKMTDEIKNTVRQIKTELRLSMNGVVSSLQRKQGLDYKINFGVEIPRIKSIAMGYEKSRSLAVALWNENIRECRMLAVFLMPVEEFTPTDAAEWIAASEFTELSDHLAMRLLSWLPNAEEHAVGWCSHPDFMYRYCGFLTLSHLLRRGKELDTVTEERFLVAAADVLAAESNENNVLRGCAFTALCKYVGEGNGQNKAKAMRYAALQHIFS